MSSTTTSSRTRWASSSSDVDQPVSELRHVLRVRDLGRVKAAVDPHDRLAVPRHRPRRGSSTPRASASFRLIALNCARFLMLASLETIAEDHRPPFDALADLLDDDAIGRGVEVAEVGDDLLVGGELVVGARLEPEDVFRPRHARDGWRLWRGGAALRDECGRRQCKGRREGEGNERAARQKGHGVLEGHCARRIHRGQWGAAL